MYVYAGGCCECAAFLSVIFDIKCVLYIYRCWYAHKIQREVRYFKTDTHLYANVMHTHNEYTQTEGRATGAGEERRQYCRLSGFGVRAGGRHTERERHKDKSYTVGGTSSLGYFFLCFCYATNICKLRGNH